MSKFSSFILAMLVFILGAGLVWSPTSWAQNSPPTANAGLDQMVNEGVSVTLDG